MMAVAGPRQDEGRALRGSMRLDEPLSRHTVSVEDLP